MPDNKAKTLKPTSDAVEILHRRFYEGKLGRLKNLEEARANVVLRRPSTPDSAENEAY